VTAAFLLSLLTLIPQVSGQENPSQPLYVYAADFDSIDTPIFYKVDPSSGQVVDTFDNVPRTSDAWGVVIVGNTMYYTVGGDSNVYKYNTATHSDEGVAFSTGLPLPGPYTLAYDGANFWIGGGFFLNNAYLFSPTGTLLKTITLSACTGDCAGLEYFVAHGRGFLISSEDNGYGSPTFYDVYDLNGNLVQSHFITAPAGGNFGIAWDGIDFWTADAFALSLSEWDANGSFVQTIPVTGWTVWPPYLADMSFDYRQTLARAVRR